MQSAKPTAQLLVSKCKFKWKLLASSSLIFSTYFNNSSMCPMLTIPSSSSRRGYCATPAGRLTSRVMEEDSRPLDRFRRDHIDSLRRRLELIGSKTPDEQDITLEKDEQTKLAKICVRSGAKNALSGKMISKLTDVLDELAEWRDGKGVLLHGFNGTFCSGSDLVSARATANLEAGLDIAQIMQYNLMRLQQLPMVSVALVEGYALGGGAELALGTDLRLMTSSARIGFVHINMGVCCGWGGGSRLVQLLGPARALDLLASGRLVGAQEALQLGLSNGTVELDGGDAASKKQQPVEQAMEFLRQHTVGAKETYAALKTMLNSARSLPLADSLKVEAQLFASTWGTEPHIRALDRNLKHHKRQP